MSSWPYTKLAQAFHKENGRNPYTMVPNRTLEVEMVDEKLSKETRVLACIRRYAWGNLSKFAVNAMPQINPNDPRPKPITQDDIGRILGFSKSTVSDACKRLRAQKWISKNRDLLFPENRITPLGSTTNVTASSGGPNYDSPSIRFNANYLTEHPEDAQILAQGRELIKQGKAMARQIELKILSAYRDFERSQAQQNQQNQQKQKENDDHLRYCAPAHNKVNVNGENMANISSGCNTIVGSDLQAKQFGPPPADVRPIPNSKNGKPNGFNPAAGRPLKPLKSLSNRSRLVSQSVPDPARLTDRQHAILKAIPPDLLEALEDRPTVALIDRIDSEIGAAPLQELTGTIRDQWAKITGLGILPALAGDTRRAWNKRRRDAEQGIPIKSEKKSIFDQAKALALTKAQYGD